MYLGVDGGGTKTEFCLLDDQGVPVAKLTAQGCSYLAVGFDGLARVLDDGVREICREAGIRVEAIDYAFFGLPSYGESTRDLEQLDLAPSRVLPRERYRCDNDMVCGWAGSLAAEDGVNVIAGTGSMTYGEYAGRKARCGGWGELFGDEGSAYWIAIEGLNGFARMSDGRLPKDALYDRFRERLDIHSDVDLIDVVLGQWRGDRAKVASLSQVVTAAAEAGGTYAGSIIRRAGDELALLVTATCQALGAPETEPMTVSYSGGMFGSGALFRSAFEHALTASRRPYSLRAPRFSPAVGAALYAAKLHGTPIDVRSTHADRQAGVV